MKRQCSEMKHTGTKTSMELEGKQECHRNQGKRILQEGRSHAKLQNSQEVIKPGECPLNLTTRKALEAWVVEFRWSDESRSFISVK